MEKQTTLRIERETDGVVICAFHRPEKRHAMNERMVDEVRALLAETRGDGARALIFTGSGGRIFFSGADIAELRDRTSADALRRINSSLFREVERFPLPTVAAMNGFALGGALEFALACDLRVCGESCRLGLPEVSLGIIPGAGGTYRLPRVVGLGRAKEMILTARLVEAPEALAMGLVNGVFPDGEVLDGALELARSVTRHGELALRLAKTAVQAGLEGSTDANMALESAAQAILFDDEEKRSRMTAFLEKKHR